MLRLPPEEAGLIARQLAELHRAAQERVGLTAALATYAVWSKISSTNPVLTADIADDIFKIARSLRGVSGRLAARYYNLARAVSSGAAFPDIGDRFTDTATLGDFYAALADSLNEVATATRLDVKLPDIPAPADTQAEGDDRTFEERLDDLEDALVEWFNETMPDTGMDDPVEIETPEEDWDWPEFDDKQDDEDLLAELEQLEQQMQDEARRVLRNDEERKLQDALKRLEGRSETHAATAAGKVDADVLSHGRRVIRVVGGVDKGRYAWMRVTGSHPCGFCSMLASRGAVYHTELSAGGLGNLYHPHCHCHVIPVFVKTPFYSARDKWFMDNWKSVTRGTSGKNALRVWRSWLTKQYSAGLVPDEDIFGPARAAT